MSDSKRILACGVRAVARKRRHVILSARVQTQPFAREDSGKRK
jgi:hypothetical protein